MVLKTPTTLMDLSGDGQRHGKDDAETINQHDVGTFYVWRRRQS